MRKPRTYSVPIAVRVNAASLNDARNEVRALMSYAFEVSNDEGRFVELHVARAAPVHDRLAVR